MEVNQLNEGLVLKTRQVHIQFVIQELLISPKSGAFSSVISRCMLFLAQQNVKGQCLKWKTEKNCRR